MTTITVPVNDWMNSLAQIHSASNACMEQACRMVHLLGYDITKECTIRHLDWHPKQHAKETREQLWVLDELVFEVTTAYTLITTYEVAIKVTPRLIAWPPPRWEGQL